MHFSLLQQKLIFLLYCLNSNSIQNTYLSSYCISWMFTSHMFILDTAVNNISRFIHVRDSFNPLPLKILFSGSVVVVSLSERTCIKPKAQNTHTNFFLIPLPLPGCLPEVSGAKSNFYVLRTHKSHRLNLIPMCHKWEVLNLKVHVLAGSLISCGRGLYTVGGSDIDSPSLCEFLKTCWKLSPDHSGVIYAKLFPYEAGINGWSQCNCLKQGISLRLMSLGRVMGLFTLLQWQGPGVIKNTNPLINFKSAGIEKGIVRNNARVFYRPLGFATLISLYYQVWREKVLPLCHRNVS